MNGARMLLTAMNDIDDRFILDVPGVGGVAVIRPPARRRLLSVLLPAAALAVMLMLAAVLILKLTDDTSPASPGEERPPMEDESPPVEDPVMVIQNGILLSYTGTDKVFTVPEEVTGIGKHAFSNANVELLYLTPGVSYIEDGALDGIKSVELTEGSAYYFLMDSVLISVGENKPVFVPAAALTTTYYFPEGTTVIKPMGEQLKSYTLVILPDSVKEIRPSAFEGCTNLRYIALNEGLETIGRYAFGDCKQLKMITIPKNVTRIEQYTFRGCSSLEQVIFAGDRINYIGRWAFQWCSSLDRLDIPFVGAVVEKDAFEYAGCEYLGPGKWIGDGYYNGTVLVKADTGVSGCFTVLEGTEILGDFAFRGARFDQILLPDSVKQIGADCFRDCDSLLEIHLPASVSSIAETAFAGCDLLTSIEMEEGNTNGFFSRDGVLYLESTLLAYPAGKGDTQFTVDAEISALASHAFYGQRCLRELVIASPVVSLKGSCFGSCQALERVTFLGKEIRFSDGETGEDIFANSKFLRDVRFLGALSAPTPGNLLSSATSLTDVYFVGTQQQWEAFGCQLKETVTVHYNFEEEET
ncbi:MAG: leucine-rich repeat domain-containing protein [Clostridia bacterium]|nr:leucine-rich repeat domain-containing protein [Clostridia bacterium]